MSDELRKDEWAGGAFAPDATTNRAELRRAAPSAARVVWKIFVLLCRFGLAAMFLFAFGAKLYTFDDFVGNMANLVPAGWAWAASVAVAAVEALVALLLLVPRTARLGALAAALLLVFFAGYALYYVYVLKGEPLECGCFGRLIASQLGVSTALRNLLLVVPAAVVFFGHRRRRARPKLR